MESHGSQQEVFQALSDPAFYPHRVRGLERKETHISVVFLTGEFAYKVKKAVDFGFADFTTLKRRRHFCRREVELNRRLSQGVYLGVSSITRSREGLRLDAPGRVVEYAVRMRQLPEERTFRRLLDRDEMSEGMMSRLAGHLHRFYAAAAVIRKSRGVGTWDTVRKNCEENFSQLAPHAGFLFELRPFQIVQAATRSFLNRHRNLFRSRLEGGLVRDCHGDLRTDHVYFTDTVQVIDCIEFNNRFRFSDIVADLAFLAMDLDAGGHDKVSESLLQTYAGLSGDAGFFILLDFYKCYRAMVRLKVSCLRKTQGDASRRLGSEIRRYLSLAYLYAVQMTRPTLWAFCGMPTSGKSTLARALASALSIQVFHSDVERKRLFGLKPDTAFRAGFGEGIYSRQATSLTYGRLLLAAQERIEKGESVILDATFSERVHREAVRQLAREADANLVLVVCRAPAAVLKKRLRAREGKSGISDAREALRIPLTARFEQLADAEKQYAVFVDTSGSEKESLATILMQDHALLSQKIQSGALRV